MSTPKATLIDSRKILHSTAIFWFFFWVDSLEARTGATPQDCQVVGGHWARLCQLPTVDSSPTLLSFFQLPKFVQIHDPLWNNCIMPRLLFIVEFLKAVYGPGGNFDPDFTQEPTCSLLHAQLQARGVCRRLPK